MSKAPQRLWPGDSRFETVGSSSNRMAHRLWPGEPSRPTAAADKLGGMVGRLKVLANAEDWGQIVKLEDEAATAA
eukprot:5610506-Prymnesium_polylepis.1